MAMHSEVIVYSLFLLRGEESVDIDSILFEFVESVKYMCLWPVHIDKEQQQNSD